MDNIKQMRRLLIVSCLLLVVSCFAEAVVDIGEIGVGARPLAMGKACMGGIDDASAIFTNPASLALNPNFTATSMSGTLFNDVNYLLMGVSENSPLGKLGIGYLGASVGGIPVTTIEGSGSTAEIKQIDTTDYLSSIIFFSYATKLSRILKGKKGDNICVGGSLKVFSQGFSGGGSALQDAVGAGIDADLGIIWKVNPWASLGLSVNNFLPASFGGKFVWQKNQAVESIPMGVKAGGEFKILGVSAILPREEQKLNLLVDYERGKGSNYPAVGHLGLEYWPLDVIALRLGLDQKAKATEAGGGVDNNFTTGVGLKYRGFTFDYAYHQFGELAQNATHFFSFGYQGEDKSKGYYRRGRKRISAVPLAEVVPKPELEAFADIPEKFWARKPIEYLATLGIMSGYPNKTFRPNKALTRGELAVLLVKAKGFDISKSRRKVVFWDVKSKNWLAPYINIVVNRKYMSGYPDGTFRPNHEVNRAEAALIFAKFSGLYVKPKVQKKVFPDVAKAHWASPAIAASKEAGFLAYLAGKKFGPHKYLTRAEAAEILSKTPTVKKKIKKLISGEE